MSRAAAFIKEHTEYETVELKSGKKVRMRPMSATLGLAIVEKYRAREVKDLDAIDIANIVADSLMDDEGSLVFESGEEAMKLPLKILSELAQNAQRVSGTGEVVEGEPSVPEA